MAMKPIETRYKGYRFRSRLEARWAVFFDHMDYEWEFEPEGFELSDGSRYLPDFRVEGEFLEVKAIPGDMEQFKKAKQLTLDTGLNVICVAGNPSTIAYPVYSIGVDSEICICDVIFRHKSERKNIFWWNCGLKEWSDWSDKLWEPSEHLMRAIYAARSARFEFGESGADKLYNLEGQL